MADHSQNGAEHIQNCSGHGQNRKELQRPQATLKK